MGNLSKNLNFEPKKFQPGSHLGKNGLKKGKNALFWEC
jgi:hypothetical protein